jgi:pyruvate formate lyase activating enzyme
VPVAESAYATTAWHGLPDGRLQCDVCPRACALRDGQRGLCFVRQRQQDRVVLTTYGRSSGFCVDPIEKKPLNHVLPGSPVLSFGTAGCNLTCRFCQNWDISKSREIDTLADEASPEAVARTALELGCRSVAFTYNDPTIFYEYARDVAIACHEVGLLTVAVSAGYMSSGPRAELYEHVDAANIDLKSFDEGFYHRICSAHLQPVLETIQYLVREARVWTELTTLLIPGLNDSDGELDRLTRWVVDAIGPDVPLHFTAFHPDFKMRDRPRTPPETLQRARRIALGNGVHYAYTGNVSDLAGGSTSCPACGTLVIERDWYAIGEYRLTDDGRCLGCGTPIPGRFAGPPGGWGPRRMPVRLGHRGP